MTANSPQSIKTWMNHINGTIALLNFRGEELLECEFGIAIFTQARIQAVSAAIIPILLTISVDLLLPGGRTRPAYHFAARQEGGPNALGLQPNRQRNPGSNHRPV